MSAPGKRWRPQEVQTAVSLAIALTLRRRTAMPRQSGIAGAAVGYDALLGGSRFARRSGRVTRMPQERDVTTPASPGDGPGARELPLEGACAGDEGERGA